MAQMGFFYLLDRYACLDAKKDPLVEYQIKGRLSFIRFLGLGLGDRVPDAKTVWLYREALAQAGKMEESFKLFNRHLARQGYIARGG